MSKQQNVQKNDTFQSMACDPLLILHLTNFICEEKCQKKKMFVQFSKHFAKNHLLGQQQIDNMTSCHHKTTSQ